MNNGPSGVGENELGRRLKRDGWILVSLGEEWGPWNNSNGEKWKDLKPKNTGR